MSLEKFQATDAWIKKFKNLLFTERKPPTTVSTVPEVSQRPSLDLTEEFQVLLEEKKIPRRSSRKMPRPRDEEQNKENFDKDFVLKTPTKNKSLAFADATLVPDCGNVMEITNTSFETLEKMCEKSITDSDSTLFKYLHDGSTTLQPRRDGKSLTMDEEAAALQRLLDELNVEETEKRLRGPDFNNITQLDDIETPSKFWENTFTAETLQSISPVKKVGLMRASTIIEETSDLSESETSSTSYQSAMKTTGYSSETTGCYETASDTVSGSENENARISTTMDLFQQRCSRQKFFDDKEKSFHLIDLETTIRSPEEGEPNSSTSPCRGDAVGPTNSLQSSESHVKIEPESKQQSTELEEDSLKPHDSDEPENSIEPSKVSQESVQSTELEESSSVIELSDDEMSEGSKILEKIEKLESEREILNLSFTIESVKPEKVEEEDEKSLHFNDTMEEVEYMMNRGMQYMEAAKFKPTAASPASPANKLHRYRSPSPMLSSPLTPKTVISKPKPIKKHTLDIKPFPKLDLFKKPQPSGLKPPAIHNKFVSSVKNSQYAHIVSPIGAYINKTPTTPLMTTVKANCNTSPATSKAFKKLDYDTRNSPQNWGKGLTKVDSPNHQVSSLPKKAYISSEYKHIVDKRTPFTIPGGPKIQRYLVSSMIPAVVRHEGKSKLPRDVRMSDIEPMPKNTDDSLAGLSMVSGDVSLYTIKDAQKF